MVMNLLSAKVIERQFHMDMIVFTTDLPGACYGEDKASILMWAAARTGAEYVKANFPSMPLEVIKS